MDNLSTIDKKSHKSDTNDNQILSSNNKSYTKENRETNHFTPEKADSIQEKKADKVIFGSNIDTDLIKISSVKQVEVDQTKQEAVKVEPFKDELPVHDIVKNACYGISPCLKSLTETFRMIEKSLGFLQLCSKTTFFPDIKNYIRIHLRSEIHEIDIFRIMTICPDMYKHSYEINEKSNDYEIYITHVVHTSKLASQFCHETKSAVLLDPKSVGKSATLQKNTPAVDYRLHMWNNSIYKYVLEKHENFLKKTELENELDKSHYLYDYRNNTNWCARFLKSDDFLGEPENKIKLERPIKSKSNSTKCLKNFLNKKCDSDNVIKSYGMDKIMQNCDKGNNRGSATVKLQADRILEVIREKERKME